MSRTSFWWESSREMLLDASEVMGGFAEVLDPYHRPESESERKEHRHLEALSKALRDLAEGQ